MRAFLLVLLAGGAADPDDAPPPDTTGPAAEVLSPSGAPQDTHIRISWTNGDPTAFARVYIDSTLLGTADPGDTFFDTVYGLGSNTRNFTVSHYKNGQETPGVTFLVTGVGNPE